jgi:hypothetical protein
MQGTIPMSMGVSSQLTPIAGMCQTILGQKIFFKIFGKPLTILDIQDFLSIGAGFENNQNFKIKS